LLVALAKHEEEVEGLRQKLASLDSFEPYSVYRLIDTINKKEIWPEDFIHLFKIEKGENLSQEEASAFIRILDYESKGFLTIENLSHCVLPRLDKQLREYCSMKPIQENALSDDQEAKQELTSFLLDLIKKEVKFYLTT